MCCHKSTQEWERQMPLWNELEGTRIADRYPLKTLLRSEGRTAWFETERPGGGRAVISLAESMNDEATLLARLEAASRLKHPNLITIFETGSATVRDPHAGTPGAEGDTPLVYGVMEPFDEGLADVLRERPLTAEETGEIADSLLPALEAVHAAGLVHGRVEPASVLAAGEIVKLRSDCLHIDGNAAARHEDVRGFAATLYQALTQKRATGSIDTSRLPAPFASIIRNGLGGQWTLLDVRRAMKGPAVETAAAAPAAPATSRPAAPVAAAPAPVPSGAARPVPAAPVRPASPPPPPVTPPASAPRREPAQAPTAGAAGERSQAATAASAAIPSAALPHRPRHADPEAGTGDRGRKRPGIAIAAAALVVLIALWLIFHRHAAAPATAAQGAQETVAPAGPPAAKALPGGTSVRPSEAVSESMGAPGAMPAEPVRPSGLRGKPSAVTSAGTPVGGAAAIAAAHGSKGVWHVIVYTYDLQDKAQRKADELAQKHADLSPQVFSPTGSRPFLVTLGGGMTKDEAFALRDKARAEGMPRDIYAQNWSK